MDWFRRMSERDRLNSILPFFLPAVHVDFTSTSAPRIYTLEIMILESSRDFYQILLQRFANQSWIRLKDTVNRDDTTNQNFIGERIFGENICCCTDIIPYSILIRI